MPLLGKVFGKREKSSTNLEVPESSPARKYSVGSSKSSDYVLPDLNTPPDVNGSESGHRTPSPSKQATVYTNSKGSSSGSRMKLSMSGFRRKATSPDPTSPRSSSSFRDSLDPPPSRTSVFTAFGRSSSSQSLPNDTSKSPYGAPQLPPMYLPDDSLFKRPPPITSRTLPVPKTPEMRTSNTVKIFNRGSKPTRVSDAPKLDLQIPSSSQDPLDSFNLKSFRPVRPASPSPSNALDLRLPSPFTEQPRSQSPANLAPPSSIGDPRPRGSSMGSDTSQKITVAQFRQAQLESAKNRSSVHLPVPDHPSDSMPPGNVPLHMSLARPVSPSFALAAGAGGNGGNASGNESVGDAAAPSRPGRLLPPQAMGRSSPIPRERTPVSSSPMRRPQSGNQPQEGARMSAKWMVDSDSDTNSSEGTASDDASRSPSKKPPLIGDFRKLKGANSPKPDASSSSNSPYPSSFSGTPKNRASISGSKSDLGHSSSSTARHHVPHASPASLSILPPVRPNSSFTSSPSPVYNIKPGQYSGGGSPVPQRGGSSPAQYGGNILPGSPAQRSPSVMTQATGESVDVWSNTHSAAHSRQGSYDQLFKQSGSKGVAQSDLGHDGSMIKRSAGVRRTGTGSKSLAIPSSKSPPTRSQSANVITQPAPSSFSSKVGARAAAPVATDTEDEEEPPSSTEDDHPLSTLVPPRRPGSGLSSQGSGSPVTSNTNLPLRNQSPARSARSTATHMSRGSLGGMSVPTSRSMTMPELRKGSTSPAPASKEPTSEPKSSLPRGRKPLIDLTTSEPTPADPSKKPPSAAVSYAGPQQGSLLTPPISEQGFPSPSLAETTRRQSPPAPSSSHLGPGPSAIQRSHDHIIRPFARDDSPASSIANSSVGSGRFPATPGTGSDAGRSIGKSQSIVTTSSGSSGNNDRERNGGKRTSVTFDDTVVFTPKKGLHRRGPSGGSAGSAGGRNSYDEQDEKRNERRRSEAKASVELGRVVNGPAPVDSDDDGQDNIALMPNNQNQPQNWNPWQNQQMQAMSMNIVPPTPGISPMNMNMSMGNPMFNPMMSQMPQMNMGGMMGSQQMFNPMMQSAMGMQLGMGMPMGFNLPPVPPMSNMMMGMDPSMMAAHHQAMAMAKQAYQMAVAQQAIAAAGDEWERSSNMGGYGGASRPPTLFGAPTGSVYGGGSLLGMPTGGSVWGGSVYGDAFGPSQHQHGRQMAAMGGGQYGSALGIDDSQTRGQNRKRTVTAPSSALPPAHLRGAGAPPMPPPSSWRPS